MNDRFEGQLLFRPFILNLLCRFISALLHFRVVHLLSMVVEFGALVRELIRAAPQVSCIMHELPVL